MGSKGGLSEEYGHIGMLFLEEARRGGGLGIQLIGEAVSVSRSLGKRGVSLRVWEKNHNALRLYRKAGFSEVGREDGLFGKLLQMKMETRVLEGS